LIHSTQYNLVAEFVDLDQHEGEEESGARWEEAEFNPGKEANTLFCSSMIHPLVHLFPLSSADQVV
jgi:hypothetical protein